VLMPAGPLDKPVADRLRLVARGVVHDDMHVEAGGNVALDLVEELAELLCPVAGHALADHRTGLHVGLRGHGCDEASEQRRGAVPLKIVRAPLDLAGTHRQHRLGAIEGLDLALLVDADDELLVGRIEVKADDIPNFLNELRVSRELERLGSMRLQRKGAPDATHGGGRDAGRRTCWWLLAPPEKCGYPGGANALFAQASEKLSMKSTPSAGCVELMPCKTFTS
jgi:hypothetical protein